MAERLEHNYPLSHENWVRSRGLFGDSHLIQNDGLNELDPEIARLCICFVHEHMYPRTVLSQKVRELCAVAALTVLGGQRPGHIRAAIHAGATREEVLEAIVQMFTYCGVPKTLNAVAVYRKTIAELGEAEPGGAAARPPQAPAPLESDGLTVRERAFATASQMYGEPDARAKIDDLDSIDLAFSQAFQELVFGGLYSRRVVDDKTRQLLAVAGCVVANALPQLESHARVGLRLGLTAAEIREVVLQMSVYTGFPYVMQALGRLRDVLAAAAPS